MRRHVKLIENGRFCRTVLRLGESANAARLNPRTKLRADDPQSLRHIENAFPTDRETLLEIKDLLDRADRLEAEERREAAGQPAKPTLSYVEFMARRAGISVEEQERRMGLAPRPGQGKPHR